MNDLGTLFHQLRDEEARNLPSLRLRGEGAAKRRVRGLAPALIMIILAVVLGVAVFHHRPAPVTESIVTWKAPTDFLLRTPGSELLTSVPRIPDLPERK